jgi:uncharacterized membrane protein
MADIVSRRIASVDILRGIIMVIMALDHARDYFSNYRGDPLDFNHVSVAMFFTRWTTHFCAPVFIFLSGTSAFLSFNKGKTKKEASLTLLTRGIWLLLLELTVIRFGWQFNFDYSLIVFQVIWAIGWSMIFLAGFIYLPIPIIATIGFVIVFGHNSLDMIQAKNFGDNAVYWDIIHEQGFLHFKDGINLFVIYPLIPWIGVMALGYCFGTILLKPELERNKWLYRIGIGAITLFILLRWSNLYGDRNVWAHQSTALNTVLDFIKCEKYPPSLLYLLMTIGPAIALMPLLENANNKVSRFFSVYGRVPMFYYILHIYLLHEMALLSGIIAGAPIEIFTKNGALFDPKNTWGFSLGIVYLYWISAVLLLYFPCRWFMKVKAKHKKWWLSYL